MINLPIALQVYSLRGIYAENPLKAMKIAKEAGYDGVEFYGDEYMNEFYAALLKQTGLVCSGWHTGLDALENDFEKVVARNIAVGNRYICVPWYNCDSLDGWKSFADRLNKMAERLAPYGIRTGYHSHAHDHTEVNGYVPWDVVAENTDSKVILQIDTGNALAAGIDVMEAVKKYPGRNQSIHFKPYAKEGGYVPFIGKDDIDWNAMLRWCETDGATEWAIVEYEDTTAPVEGVTDSLVHLRNLQA